MLNILREENLGQYFMTNWKKTLRGKFSMSCDCYRTNYYALTVDYLFFLLYSHIKKTTQENVVNIKECIKIYYITIYLLHNLEEFNNG